jgi:hypothetical protein
MPIQIGVTDKTASIIDDKTTWKSIIFDWRGMVSAQRPPAFEWFWLVPRQIPADIALIGSTYTKALHAAQDLDCGLGGGFAAADADDQRNQTANKTGYHPKTQGNA